MLQRLKNDPKVKEVDNIDPSILKEDTIVDIHPAPKEDQYNSMVKDGVEVVDVKAIERLKKKNNQPSRLGNRYNLGIPINKGEHRNFDEI